MTEVRYSTLDDVIDYRIEAEYFDSKFLNVDKRLSAIATVPFIEVASFKNGRPYSSECFNLNSGIKVGKIGDVTNKRDIADWEFVEVDEFLNQSGQLLSAGDILMTLTGDPPDVGKVNYVYSPVNATWNQRVAMIRLIDDQNIYIDNDVLYAILSTETVRAQLERYAKGIRQRNLGNESLERLLLPIISKDLQNAIKHCVKDAYSLYDCSIVLYNNAENMLREYLGLTSVELDNVEPSIKSINDSFIISGRLDAEYYQPKYDELFALLGAYDTKTLSEIVNIEKSIEPGSEAYQTDGIPFIRVANLSKFGIADTDVYLSTEEYGDIIRPEKDTILLSKDGSVGIAYKVEKYTNIITSGAILHLTVKDDSVMPDYLTLVLNSIVVKMQAERDAGGSVIQHWKPSEIEKVVIPILDNEVQVQITEKVQESFALRKESIRLLELAKTAVEVAIEQGEDKAMELLTQDM